MYGEDITVIGTRYLYEIVLIFTLQRILSLLVSSEDDYGELLKRFREYLDYDDNRYHYMRFMQNAIKEFR